MSEMPRRTDQRDSAGPTARSDRFRPTRCGVINLWDYRDEEFVFADGRMVLRGPNGSGKTKALEVLFPFVLDGRIEPRRLNPFASEERTMKSNLLYRGQESGYAYAWLEFRRESSSGDGTGEIVTVGAGLHAQRQNDRVTRWYFVVDGQIGRDFGLLGADDRPLTKRQLAEQIGGAAITDRSVEHRTAIDNRLFGLGRERFEQLLTLVLTLRRPQLARNLDPKGLSRALSDGLRPLDDGLILEAAHSFGDMENVQRTLAGLVQADAAASSFLAGYATYLRTHARAAGDAVTTRLVDIESRRAELAGALAARRRSAADLEEICSVHAAARAEHQRLTARLESLKASPAYKSKEQLGRLTGLIAKLGEAADREEQAAADAANVSQRRKLVLRAVEDAHRDAVAAVARAAGELTEAARDAGVDWTGADSADDGELEARASARAFARQDDVTAIRSALAARDEARQLRDNAEKSLLRAQGRLRTADDEVARAHAAAVVAREGLVAAIAEWLSAHRATLDQLPEKPDAELHQLVRSELSLEAERVGTPTEIGLPAVFEALTADHRQRRRDEQGRAKAELTRQLAEIEEWRRERAAIADEQDQAPPPSGARATSREGRAGAPLWALVDFAQGVDDRTAAAVEAALEAANILDAWVSPDDPDPGRDPMADLAAPAPVEANPSDAVLLPLPPESRPAGPTLAQLLVPEPVAAVAESRVAALLTSVALVGDSEPVTSRSGPAPAIWTTGRFQQGIQLAAHHKEHAEYIGATARAQRRAARLAALDTQIHDAEQRVARTESVIAMLGKMLERLEAARRALPSATPVIQSLRTLDRAAVTLRTINTEVDNARSDFDKGVAAVGGTERLLLAAGSARSMPTILAEVDQVAAALGRFTKNADELRGARYTAILRAENLADAHAEVDAATELQRSSSEQAESARADHRGTVEELNTLRAAVGAGVDQLEIDVAQTGKAQRAAADGEQQTQHAVERAIELASKEEALVSGVVARLSSAVTEAQRDSHRLAPYVRADIRDVLRLPDGIPGWPTAGEQWNDPDPATAALAEQLLDDPDAAFEALPRAVSQLHAGILAVTADLRPTESSLKSSRTRVSQSLAELQNQLSAAGHDYRPEWEADDDVIVVKVADEQGFSSIWTFAQRISDARRDQELLLTESEQRILEDALLGRLAQQIHERTTDARDLVAAMNREMRSRRMSSGATVGIGWELADGVGSEQRMVNRLLDRKAAQLSTEELARMRAHFAAQIKNLRSARPDRPYSEILADALDYRRSRVFVLTLVAPDGREDPLTQARHGTLSGGEQSVSLHLPLFAAAHVMLSRPRTTARDCWPWTRLSPASTIRDAANCWV
jgi:uncharacterized protein (TIGR02680 family)